MTRRRVIGVGLLVLALGGVIAAEALSGGVTQVRKAPALPSQVLSGPRVDLASLRGKPAMVNFWASWCTPCRQEAPQLERFARSAGRRVSVVGVDWNDDAGSAGAFIAANHLTYPILRDQTGEVGTAYGLSGLPTTFVLDASGRIVATLRGPQSLASLRQALSSAIGPTV